MMHSGLFITCMFHSEEQTTFKLGTQRRLKKKSLKSLAFGIRCDMPTVNIFIRTHGPVPFSGGGGACISSNCCDKVF